MPGDDALVQGLTAHGLNRVTVDLFNGADHGNSFQVALLD
jgi:hypothetical protein